MVGTFASSPPASPPRLLGSELAEPSASISPRRSSYRQLSELRTTATTTANKMNSSWPTVPSAPETMLSLPQQISASREPLVDECADCAPAADCDDPACPEARLDDCTHQCITEECTDQCVVVACDDPTHEQQSCHAVVNSCEGGPKCSVFPEGLVSVFYLGQTQFANKTNH
jgi:hypothetical protein